MARKSFEEKIANVLAYKRSSTYPEGMTKAGRLNLRQYAVNFSLEGWWKGRKQFLPAKSAEHEETPVRYSNSEVSHLRPREVPTLLQTESAVYAQPLVGGIVGTLHQRSTFKPEEGKEESYADVDPYNSPVQEVYHAYAEPLPVTGPEYATPIIMDMSRHSTAPLGVSSISTFKATGNQAPPIVGTCNKLLARTDS